MVEKRNKIPSWEDFKKDPEIKQIKLILRVILFIALFMIIGSVFNTIFASANLKSSQISNNIEYTFANDNLFNSTELGQQSWWDNSSNIFNIRPKEVFTENYNATYTFENDTIGANATGFDISIHNGNASIISEFEDHSKVVNITGIDNSAMIWDNNSISPLQWLEFNFTEGSGNTKGELETNDNNFGIIDVGDEPGVGESLLGIIRPNADILTNWNDGAVPPHWSKLNEVSPNNIYIKEETAGILDKWYFTNLTVLSGHIISKMIFWFYVKSDFNMVDFDLTSNEAIGVHKIDCTTSWLWKSSTWSTASMNQDDLNNFWLGVDNAASFPPGWANWIDTVYIQVYTTPPVYLVDYEIVWNINDIDLKEVGDLYYDYRTSIIVELDLDIYNWDTTTWIELESNTVNTYITDSYPITDNYINSSNYIKIRFQSLTDNNIFIMELDQIMLNYSSDELLDLRSLSIYDTFDRNNGTIEFWSYFNNNSLVNRILFNDNTYLYHNSSSYYWNYDNNEILISTMETQQWVHFSITWNNNDVSIILNALNITNTVWGNSSTNLTRIDFMSFENYSFYIDAIGYNWSFYNIGDNLFPLTEIILGEYEVDEWIFHTDYTTRMQYEDGSDNPSGWSDWLDAPPVIDNVNTLVIGWSPGEPDWGYQRWNVIDIESSGGLYRNFNGLNDSNIYFEASFSVNQITGGDVNENAINFGIRDSDDTSYISYFRLKYDGTVSLFYNETTNILGTIDIYNNYTISYNLNMDLQIQHFILKYWNNNTIIYDIIVPFYNNIANDIDRIKYEHVKAGGIVESYLFNIIIYGDNGSYSDDIGIIQWNQITTKRLGFYEDNWIFADFNLIDFYGNFEEVSLIVEAFGGIIWEDFFNWTSVDTYKFINIYRSGYVSGYYGGPKALVRGNFTFDSISIDGVKLIEGSNFYSLVMGSSVDMNITESYFYVSGNRLYYSLTTYNNDLEYITAQFYINTQSTTNYTLLYGGIKSYLNLISEFRLNYLDTTYSYNLLKVIPIYQNVIIPQGHIIESFEFLITDNDNDIDFTITGYFYSFELVSTIGIGFTIIISDYLAILTPILLITIITITIWQMTKKKVQNMLIAPSIILMSFSVFAMGLIPVWILFILIICSGILMYTKWEDNLSIFSSFSTMITAFLSYVGIIPFWLFYISFIITIGYLIFGIRKTVRG